MPVSAFAKWYLAKLRAKPYLVNVGSGLVLMSTGDVLAQRVEVVGGGGAGEQEETKERRRRRPTGATAADTATAVGDSSSSETEETSGPSSALATAAASVGATFDDAVHNLKAEIEFWDKFRTAKMAAWTLVYSPFYVGIYKLYDRYLPRRGIPSVAARVGLSFALSIPINFAFYAYGNFAQHTADWYSEASATSREDNHGDNDNAAMVPYRFDLLIEKTRSKLEAEFAQTVKTSATFWVPINFFSFSVLPSHVQPLSLMFFSVFWNCYLSLSQHREVEASPAAASDADAPEASSN